MDARNPGAGGDRQAARDGPRLSARSAQQGVKTGHVRWVLAVSTVLAAAAVAIAWLVIYRPGPTPSAAAGPPTLSAPAPEPPLLQRDQTPASNPPANAAPQSSRPLP